MSEIMAIRGATTVERDCREEIEAKTTELIAEIVRRNNIGGNGKRCVSVVISTTKDIHSWYPARAVRESGLLSAPLFSCEEPDIAGALPLCIRVMVTVSAKEYTEPNHVYLHGAVTLRPDLNK